MNIRDEIQRIIEQYVDGNLRIVDGELVSDLSEATFIEYRNGKTPTNLLADIVAVVEQHTAELLEAALRTA